MHVNVGVVARRMSLSLGVTFTNCCGSHPSYCMADLHVIVGVVARRMSLSLGATRTNC